MPLAWGRLRPVWASFFTYWKIEQLVFGRACGTQAENFAKFGQNWPYMLAGIFKTAI